MGLCVEIHLGKEIVSESYENKNLCAYKSAVRRGKEEWCHFIDLRDLMFHLPFSGLGKVMELIIYTEI